ncbi:MAG: tol-pal system protein YbgF [Proteobacteria bacterium]|nr:tol-pal system protein YbgF [Pseudomonadota bacterium]MDA1355377.1 tol-pal system protein YbgF [Pseudomonadota bacterium]
MKALRAVLLCGGLVIFLALSPAAHAQNESAVLRSQIELLKGNLASLSKQFQDLQQFVFTNSGGEAGANGAAASVGTTPGAGDGFSNRRLAIVESRLDQIDQNEMRKIEGQFDELRNLIERMDSRLEKLVADVDFRLTALESAPRGASQTTAGNGQAPGLLDSTDSDLTRPGGASSLVDPDDGYQPSGSPRILGTIPLEDGVVEPFAPEPEQTAHASILPDGTPEERYKYALGLLRKAQYDEADRVLGAFIEVHGEHPLADNASFWRGETFYARKMFGDAARIYATNLQLYPEGGKAPDNMVKLGMALANLERTKEACQAFAELDRKFPDMPANVRQAADRGRSAASCP